MIVQKFAFRTVVKPDVELHVQDVVALNFSMELGSVAQSVTVEAGAPLIQAGPQRGGNFLSREVRDLPLMSLNPISLARTLPGAIQPAGSSGWAQGGEATQFSVNGQRPRANNYLLDSTENNDISFTGVAQAFNIADAVEEVSVQTGNFGSSSAVRAAAFSMSSPSPGRTVCTGRYCGATSRNVSTRFPTTAFKQTRARWFLCRLGEP